MTKESPALVDISILYTQSIIAIIFGPHLFYYHFLFESVPIYTILDLTKWGKDSLFYFER